MLKKMFFSPFGETRTPYSVVRIMIVIVVISYLLKHCKKEKRPWWKNSIVYQIYPRSFHDTNGDGTGDLKGITAKADYLYDLGVKTLWISPFFTSPMADSGYDISNFVDVDPIFGSLADLDELLKTMHSKDIKVVLDFVPNHSSDEHEWFQRSLRREEPFADYYVWADPKGFSDSGNPIPPNNWLSKFRGSAWEWREERGQFYYHQYHRKQPDLNYRNLRLQEEIKFWMDRGADGFRVDALKHLFEVEDLSLDEPVNEEAGVEDNLQYNYLKHPFTMNQPETFEVVRDWRKMMNTYSDKWFTLCRDLTPPLAPWARLLIVQVYNKDIQDVVKYYGSDTDPLADFPFNFRIIKKLHNRSDVTGTRLMKIIDEWFDNLPEGKWPNWVLGSHDHSRVASRLGADLVDALNMLTLLLPGTPVTYFGEEIGMQDTEISWEDTKDPQGRNFGPDHYRKHSRDPCRTPMQWDATANAGFSKGPSTWLPVNDNYKTLNVKAQSEARESHLKVYKTLARLRQESSFAKGKLAFPVVTDEVLAFIRYLEDEPTYLVVLNLSENDVVVDLHQHTNLELPPDASVITRSVSDKSEENSPGPKVSLSALMLVKGEGLVLQLTFAKEIE
ncbi:maltase A3-like isoform X2 [Oratosquilla oratoria]|uniref:maltase A3-like isoform X2 n=1 Tax=Oratosquilla oratoria TaxID=337810 RepID=UPI003F763D8E